MIRSPSDVVLAANYAMDLAALVVQYLELWRKHANGRNDVVIPSGKFNVAFKPVTNPDQLDVVLFHTVYYSTSTPNYDYDDDEVYHPLGSSPEPTSYSYSSGSYEKETAIGVSMASILKSPEQMETDILDFVKRDDAAKAEAAKQARIDQLQKELADLTKQPVAIK